MSTVSVLHVINKLSPSGGAEVSLAQLAPGLTRLGVRQTVATLLPTSSPAVVERLAAEGVGHVELGGSGTVTSVRALRRAVARDRPHLLSSSLYEANRAARLTGAITRTPVLTALVNTPYSDQALRHAPSPRKLRAVAAVERLTARHLTTHFHALTQAAGDAALHQLGVPPGAVTVVPRARDRSTLGEPGPERRRDVRAALELPDDALVVLNVARQERQKGQVQLVEAFEVLASHDPRAVLLVAGRQGAATPDLEARVAASPARERVRLLGLRTDVPDLLAAADLFAFSSLWEGLGGAVLEALAMEVPVAAYDVPAVVEALGGHGLLAPTGDARALGARLVTLAQDEELRQRLAQGGRRRFDSTFTLEAVVPQMEALYRAVAASAAPLRRASR